MDRGTWQATVHGVSKSRTLTFPFTFLGLHVFTAEGLGSITGRGTKISQAAAKKKERVRELSHFFHKKFPEVFQVMAVL